jgi:hypothetical protein
MGAPQGYVLSPLLYSLFTHDCTARHDSKPVIKFANDTTVVGLITDNDETAYREEVRHLTMWCNDSNLSLNVIKTKEMIVDYRKRTADYAPILIDGAIVEQVESFKFLASTSSTNSHEEGTTKPIPPQETEKIWHGSSDPQKFLQLHPQEHPNPNPLHHRLIWQLLSLRPQGTTEGSAYGPIHHQGQACCHPEPLYQAVSEEGPKNCQRLQPP